MFADALDPRCDFWGSLAKDPPQGRGGLMGYAIELVLKCNKLLFLSSVLHAAQASRCCQGELEATEKGKRSTVVIKYCSSAQCVFQKFHPA